MEAKLQQPLIKVDRGTYQLQVKLKVKILNLVIIHILIYITTTLGNLL